MAPGTIDRTAGDQQSTGVRGADSVAVGNQQGGEGMALMPMCVRRAGLVQGMTGIARGRG